MISPSKTISTPRRPLSVLALLLLLPLARPVLGGTPKTCTAKQVSQLSCQNTTAVPDLCCFNAPGGSFLQTQFWDTDPPTGPADSWTIHGLWPDRCDGTYDDAGCDAGREYGNITEILLSSSSAAEEDLLDYMRTYWKADDSSDEAFWEHEWGKHGTCISSLEPGCIDGYEAGDEVFYFFNATVALFRSLPTYEWLTDAGITPGADATYALDVVRAALEARHGAAVYVGCSGNTINQVYYYYNVGGSVADGDFVAVAPPDGGDDGGCSSMVSYLPKTATTKTTATQTTTTATTATSTPTSTGSFSGKGYLNVVTDGSTTGCIISGGTWYTTGTCASFTAAAASGSGDEFTLASSKGACDASGGELLCGSDVNGSTFSADGTYLVNAQTSSDAWYADSVPSGSTQGTVYSDTGSHGVTLQIQWQSV